ncbi:MAG: helix-turn-helix domain-containing protein [Prevotella sp.]|nr:helix-turn-helix domain-containing protein [Prevotella sp.]
MANKRLNRLKIVLAENDKTNNWLAEQLGKDKATVSKWCTNTCQPDIETFMRIAVLLKVEVSELLRMDEFENEINN